MSEQKEKFTPGPWAFDDTDESFRRPAICAKGAERYSTYGPVCLVMKRHPNYKLNAALIATAPEMYAVLECLADKFSHPLLSVEFRNLASSLSKLLAKARGEGNA